MQLTAKIDMIVHGTVTCLFLLTIVLLAHFDSLDAPTASAVGIASFSILTGSDAIITWKTGGKETT